MSRKGENIYRRKDGRWEGRYKCGFNESGKSKYRSVYARTYSEVKEKLMKLKTINISYTLSGKLTVKELFEEWLSAIRFKVKESTYSCYHMKVEKHILPEFGSIAYEKLTVKQIHDFIERKIKSGLSPKYVSDIIVVFKSMSKYVSKIYNYRNPLVNVILPKIEKTEMQLLTESDQKKLCDFSFENTNSTKLSVLLSYYTGLRIGEVCALKWEDIDFKSRVLTVRRTVQRITGKNDNKVTKLLIGSPKSRSSLRIIPLPLFLAEILLKFRKENSIFVLSGTGNPVEPRTLQYRFKAFLKKADLPSVNFHSLRHMFATNCIEVGFDIKTLSEILGHSSVETTLNRYVHSSIERKTACMNLLHK